LRSHSLQLRLLNGRASKTTRIVNIRLQESEEKQKRKKERIRVSLSLDRCAERLWRFSFSDRADRYNEKHAFVLYLLHLRADPNLACRILWIYFRSAL